MNEWSYDLTAAPYDERIIVTFGTLMDHDDKNAMRIKRDGADVFVGEDHETIPAVYAWMPYPASASFNEPEAQ